MATEFRAGAVATAARSGQVLLCTGGSNGAIRHHHCGWVYVAVCGSAHYSAHSRHALLVSQHCMYGYGSMQDDYSSLSIRDRRSFIYSIC